MRDVVVLGSKPDAVVANCDIAFCANAAASHHPDIYAKSSVVVNVVSAVVLGKAIRGGEKDEASLHAKKAERIVNSPCLELNLFSNRTHEYVYDWLISQGYAYPITKFSTAERAALTRRISGHSEPVLFPDLRRHPLASLLLLVRSFWTRYMPAHFGTPGTHTAYFRPSTGLVALMLAIERYGGDARYYICGIGVSGRDHYIDGDKARGKVPITAHVNVDVRLLRCLASKYELYTTDPELSRAVGGIRFKLVDG